MFKLLGFFFFLVLNDPRLSGLFFVFQMLEASVVNGIKESFIKCFLFLDKGKGIVIQELDFEINSHHFLCRLFLSSALFLSHSFPDASIFKGRH